MRFKRWILLAGVASMVVSTPGRADPADLDVEIWTDRGNGATYRPGEALEVKVRTSSDTYLLVYQIDARVRRLLWVGRGRSEQTLEGFFRTVGAEILPTLRSRARRPASCV